MKLYSYFRSSSAYRVRIALNVKNIPYEMIPIHLLKNGGEQHASSYRAINPSEQVPTLIDGNHTIGQSMAILEYIEQKFPQTPLLPEMPHERAIVRQMCEVINSGIQPLQNLMVTQYLTDSLHVSENDKMVWLQFWINRGLTSFESLLDKYSGTYCFGDHLSFADCFLIPQVFSSQRFNIDLSRFPKIKVLNDRCLSLPAFIKASPQEQPDFQP
ncbi:MAG: maleylacetoacetate isomerase [Bdellovibrionaceae bacterium]|nr:maleylacetoacetate isomerase [Pseudobdellovibrionaceae bacterium]